MGKNTYFTSVSCKSNKIFIKYKYLFKKVQMYVKILKLTEHLKYKQKANSKY